MGELFRTLAALLAGAFAALLWADRQRPSRATDAPEQSAPGSSAPEPIMEEIPVRDPLLEQRIEELELQLTAERARREAPPDEPPPNVDAVRAARARAYALERQLADQEAAAQTRWSDLQPGADQMLDAVVEHLPAVALHAPSEGLDPAQLWRALGAMQAFCEACQEDWFEFHGDFARWCAESGHPDALDGSDVGDDPRRPIFAAPTRVNRSGQLVVPTYVAVGAFRLYYVDDIGGETGRIHVVGVASADTSD